MNLSLAPALIMPLTTTSSAPAAQHAAPFAAATLQTPVVKPQTPILVRPGTIGEAGPPTETDTTKYYSTAQGKTGASLIHALHEIVRNGHIDRGYAQARDGLYNLVADPDRDDMIEDVYTGELRGPIHNRKEAYAKGINAEHTWPQSKGARGIAQSDLHQLMAADIKINGDRGHLPYGIVTTVEKSYGSGANVSKLGTDASGERVFEPRDSVKGDIARGLLYFYTRYNESRTRDYSLVNFRHELPVLVKWSKLDPVDKTERLANEDIFAIQGNRNPYVDHQEWVDAAGFAALQVGH